MSAAMNGSQHLVVEVEHFEQAVGILGDQVDALRGALYVKAGALKYRGSSGTITILGAA